LPRFSIFSRCPTDFEGWNGTCCLGLRWHFRELLRYSVVICRIFLLMWKLETGFCN
jgi:hypothetical protein